ncbi:hypothetical protein [Ottowia beijingensis]|uniref:hypothetical protein n=1 Tax=Ottowia beijingensis TaxID=1207057 RepID=UPI003636A9C9
MTSLRFDDKAAGVWLKARWKAGPRGGDLSNFIDSQNRLQRLSTGRKQLLY